MKKLLILLISIFCITNVFGKINIETKGGLAFIDNYSISGSGYTGRLSYLFGLEGLYESSKSTEVGIGFGYKYNSPAQGVIYQSGSDSMHLFNSYPVYGLVKYKFPELSGFLPFAKIYVGMAYNEIGDYYYAQSVKPGLYTGLGFGADYGSVVGDLTYGLQETQMNFVNPTTRQNESKSVTHSSVNFTIGYRFELPWFK